MRRRGVTLLETLVALALAWRGHAAIARTPLAAPA